MEKIQNRIEWVDALKFLGIFAIYLGHFGKAIGKLFPFVFLYHVPLFFFVSGFFARSTKKPSLTYYKDKALQLMLPYFVFSLVALIYFSVINNWRFSQIIDVAWRFLMGIRNNLYAETLWFFPCLFIIEVVHYTLLKFTKNIYIPFGISIILFAVSQILLPNNPVQKPSLFMNIDSAMYYYIYFAIGSISFPYISKKFTLLSQSEKILRVTMIIISILFAFICFTKGGEWLSSKTVSFFPFLAGHYSAIYLFSLLPMALIIIYFNIWLAKCISKIGIFKKMGRETLIFCGTEKVFKNIFLRLISSFGWDKSFPNPIVTIIYCFGCLLVSYYMVVPTLNRFVPRLVGKKPYLAGKLS